MLRAFAISLAFLVACAATLGPKLRDYTQAIRGDSSRLYRELAALLTDQGYRVRKEKAEGLFAYVFAQRDHCRFSAAIVDGGGGNIAPFVDINPVKGRPRFLRDGEWMGGPPQVRLMIDSLLQQSAAQLGIAYDYPPVLMIVSDESCALGEIPWSNLRLHAARQKRNQT